MTLCTYVVHNSNNNNKLQHFVGGGTNCVIVVRGKPSGNSICMHSRGRYKLACNLCSAGAGIHTAQLTVLQSTLQFAQCGPEKGSLTCQMVTEVCTDCAI